jgi:hypothetical protein
MHARSSILVRFTIIISSPQRLRSCWSTQPPRSPVGAGSANEHCLATNGIELNHDRA